MRQIFTGRQGPGVSLTGIPCPGQRTVRAGRGRGFTLIELVVTMAILSMLMTLIMSGVRSVRGRARIQHCQNNLREIGMGLNHYTSLWRGRPLPTTGPEDDNLRPLYPDCVDELSTFVCLETGNQANTPEDLEDNAVGGRVAGRGHSYECLSYYLYDRKGNELPHKILKTRANVDIRADKVWLVMDAMEAGTPNEPDQADNHWEPGGNVPYGDCHVEWVGQGRWGTKFKSGNSK